MRSLFARIFFSFLLIIVLIAAASALLTHLRDRDFPPLPHQHFVRQALNEYGRDAIRTFEQGGMAAFDRYAETLRQDAGIRLLLFDGAGRPLGSQRAPMRLQHLAQRALDNDEVVLPMMGMARNWVASPLQGESGRRYAITLGLPEQPPPGQLARGLTHGALGSQLLLLLVVAGLVCLLLARSFAAPLARLRQTTRRFAAGDLKARVGTSLTGTQEISALARDFDDMAGRIETLVGSQRQLLRDISHELRSPLARLGVALELARQEGDPAGRQKALTRIETEAQRLNQMIGQLLDLSRLETEVDSAAPEEFCLREMLEKLVQDADYEAQGRGCRVQLQASGPALLLGAPELLARALENVIRNAVRYTAPDTLVSVSLDRLGKNWRVQIGDGGPGVPEEAIAELFKPFYRVAAARDRQSGGSGLGLAIAAQAVRNHGGSIRAENQSKGGLLVEILLPATKTLSAKR